MSKKTKLTAAVILLLVLIISAVVFMIFKNSSKPAPIKEITQFESLTLHLSGMRVTEEYEIISNGNECEISYYHFRYDSGEEKRELQKSTVCDAQEVIDILNECRAGRWNGFHGKHPKGVLDGTMFTLTASVNGGEKLTADGSQNFPKNYHAFEEWLYKKLAD